MTHVRICTNIYVGIYVCIYTIIMSCICFAPTCN